MLNYGVRKWANTREIEPTQWWSKDFIFWVNTSESKVRDIIYFNRQVLACFLFCLSIGRSLVIYLVPSLLFLQFFFTNSKQ